MPTTPPIRVHLLYSQGVDGDSPLRAVTVVTGTREDAQAEADRRNLALIAKYTANDCYEQAIPISRIVRVGDEATLTVVTR